MKCVCLKRGLQLQALASFAAFATAGGTSLLCLTLATVAALTYSLLGAAIVLGEQRSHINSPSACRGHTTHRSSLIPHCPCSIDRWEKKPGLILSPSIWKTLIYRPSYRHWPACVAKCGLSQVTFSANFAGLTAGFWLLLLSGILFVSSFIIAWSATCMAAGIQL